MFAPNPFNSAQNKTGQPQSSVEAVLNAALSFMKTKIVTSDNDKIGVVLYGCNKTQNSMDYQNVVLI